MSLLTGIRTEEARALAWDRVHLDQVGTMPPHIEVWRSVRIIGDTKDQEVAAAGPSPQAVTSLRAHKKAQQARDRLAAGELWQETGLVFCTTVGTGLDAANVRRGFRTVVAAAGIAGSWTPRELRHSVVSLLSANGVPVESIAQLVGHAGTSVTEAIYRKELRPALTDGAEVIGSILTRKQSASRLDRLPFRLPEIKKWLPVNPESLVTWVELRGIEPLTFSMRTPDSRA